MRKALRGLSGLARKFDAWMCKKPTQPHRAISSEDAQKWDLQHRMSAQVITCSGGLRDLPCMPCDRIMNP